MSFKKNKKKSLEQIQENINIQLGEINKSLSESQENTNKQTNGGNG